MACRVSHFRMLIASLSIHYFHIKPLLNYTLILTLTDECFIKYVLTRHLGTIILSLILRCISQNEDSILPNLIMAAYQCCWRMVSLFSLLWCIETVTENQEARNPPPFYCMYTFSQLNEDVQNLPEIT